MPLISLPEYGKLHIGELNPARPSVTASQAVQLRGLKSIYGFDIFKFSNEATLSAQQYVGTVQIGTLTIEILPKIEGICETTMRRNLVQMLSVALNLDISEGDVARITTQRYGILEILIQLFCAQLFIQIHRGLIRRYEGREENIFVLRGKLDIVEQVRRNAANPERLYCRFDEFQEDNPLNQVLKAAISLLLKVSRELINQRQLSELMLIFDGTSNVPVQSLPWSKVAFDRLNERYKPCFKLAKLFLRMTPPDIGAGGIQSFSLFFNMNSLFEEYVGRIIARSCRSDNIQIMLQRPQHYLALDESSQRNAFAMKPDVVGKMVGKKNTGVAWIVDTKWKQLSEEKAKEGIAQSDFYQMYAYANCYRCPEVILLYPHHAGLGVASGTRASYMLNHSIHNPECQMNGRIRVSTLDLSNLKTVPGQLRTIIYNEQKEIA